MPDARDGDKTPPTNRDVPGSPGPVVTSKPDATDAPVAAGPPGPAESLTPDVPMTDAHVPAGSPDTSKPDATDAHVAAGPPGPVPSGPPQSLKPAVHKTDSIDPTVTGLGGNEKKPDEAGTPKSPGLQYC